MPSLCQHLRGFIADPILPVLCCLKCRHPVYSPARVLQFALTLVLPFARALPHYRQCSLRCAGYNCQGVGQRNDGCVFPTCLCGDLMKSVCMNGGKIARGVEAQWHKVSDCMFAAAWDNERCAAGANLWLTGSVALGKKHELMLCSVLHRLQSLVLIGMVPLAYHACTQTPPPPPAL